MSDLEMDEFVAQESIDNHSSSDEVEIELGEVDSQPLLTSEFVFFLNPSCSSFYFFFFSFLFFFLLGSFLMFFNSCSELKSKELQLMMMMTMEQSKRNTQVFPSFLFSFPSSSSQIFFPGATVQRLFLLAKEEVSFFSLFFPFLCLILFPKDVAFDWWDNWSHDFFCIYARYPSFCWFPPLFIFSHLITPTSFFFGLYFSLFVQGK